MAFCGSCGREAPEEGKFCTGCGEPLAGAGQEEAPGGSHIGDQRRSGEWLEHTVSHVLRFAGFEAERERPFVFDEGTGDRFMIDVLAKDASAEIFVECKDLAGTKMSEKTMYTLQGQLDDYRRRRDCHVVGILAMSARDDGSNAGIRGRLGEHGCFLWDGSMIEHLQDRMVELDKAGFREYVLGQLGIGAGQGAPDGDAVDFVVRYSFLTVAPRRYAGRRFSVEAVLDDVRSGLDEGVLVRNIETQPLEYDGGIAGYRVTADFVLRADRRRIRTLGIRQERLGDRLRRRKPGEIVYEGHRKAVREAIAGAYGVSPGKGRRSHIVMVGGRVMQAGAST